MAGTMGSARRWLQRYVSLPTLLVLGALVYIVFIGDNSVARRVEYQAQIDSLNACVAQVEDSVRHYRELNRGLKSDPAAMERVVREHYNMKRQNEDVFITD
ncbi:MAG: septum formation initiator family protein [Muribaculaceae bacterium]|nr:septum formation initiator family protein [Muribaculaceae bacterium]